jgi:uncharacterized membrane protein YedE/YeeE
MNSPAIATKETPQVDETKTATQVAEDRFPRFLSIAMVLLVGIYFGIVLTKSEVVRWQRVHDMFLFKEAFMYLIICTGIVIAMICMGIIKRLGIKTIEGKPIKYEAKPYHKGVLLGGMLFGAGWAITGACPGPIYAQIGGGAWMALFTLAGALLGMYLYAWLKPKLPH